MKKFLLTAVTLGVRALPAMAADLAPVYKEQVAWSWTGFYFGGSVGGGWMTSDSTESVTSSFCNTSFAGCSPTFFGPVTSRALVAGIPGSLNTTQAGFLAGVQAGYNWQIGRYVLGFETDISGTSISGSSSYSNQAGIAGFPGFSIAAYGTQSEKLNYLGTVRGRAGYLVTDPLLAYVTGGFAYGDASSSLSLGTNLVPGCGGGPLPSAATCQSATGETSSSSRAGWTLGGGLEWMFARNFTVKGEYLYYDFGSVSYAGPSVVNVVSGSGPFYGASTAANASFKGSIVRVGLNFKL
jgi:outer membrane immunogenic protein